MRATYAQFAKYLHDRGVTHPDHWDRHFRLTGAAGETPTLEAWTSGSIAAPTSETLPTLQAAETWWADGVKPQQLRALAEIQTSNAPSAQAFRCILRELAARLGHNEATIRNSTIARFLAGEGLV